MELNQLLTIAKRYCHIDDVVQLKTMLTFYHDLGVIVKHGQTVVLQALWLIDLFKQLITVRPFDEMVNNHTPHTVHAMIKSALGSSFVTANPFVIAKYIKTMCCNFSINF